MTDAKLTKPQQTMLARVITQQAKRSGPVPSEVLIENAGSSRVLHRLVDLKVVDLEDSDGCSFFRVEGHAPYNKEEDAADTTKIDVADADSSNFDAAIQQEAEQVPEVIKEKPARKKKAPKITAMGVVAAMLLQENGASISELVAAVLAHGRTDAPEKAIVNVGAYIGYLRNGYGTINGSGRRGNMPERAWTVEILTDSPSLVFHGTPPSDDLPEDVKPVVTDAAIETARKALDL